MACGASVFWGLSRFQGGLKEGKNNTKGTSKSGQSSLLKYFLFCIVDSNLKSWRLSLYFFWPERQNDVEKLLIKALNASKAKQIFKRNKWLKPIRSLINVQYSKSVMWNLRSSLLCLFFLWFRRSHSIFYSSDLYLNFFCFHRFTKYNNLLFICSDSVLVLAYWYS